MKLTLIEKPTEEIITLAEAKQYMRISQDYDDDMINIFIKSVRESIESIIQKSILKQKWNYRIDMNNIDDMKFSGKDFPYISDNYIKIPLPRPPLISIESANIVCNDGKKISLPKIYENVYGRFYLKINCNLIPKNCAYIDVSYYSGIVERAENVPYQLKLANLMMVANAYNSRFNYDTSAFMPASIDKLLSSFRSVRLA